MSTRDERGAATSQHLLSTQLPFHEHLWKSRPVPSGRGSAERRSGLAGFSVCVYSLDSLSSKCVIPLPSWGFLRLPLSVFVLSFLMCSDSTEGLGLCTCGAAYVHMKKSCRGRALGKSRTLKLGNREEGWEDKNMQIIPWI